jgi:membrane protease YdiL (CAAX protease family)
MCIALLQMLFGNSIDYSLINPITKGILPIIVALMYIGVIYKPLKQQKIKRIVIWTIITFISVFIISQIIFRFFENNLIVFLGYESLKNLNTEGIQTQFSSSNQLYKFFLIFSTCIIGPFVEEVTYRVCLFTTLREKSKIFAHLFTAFLFGFQHIAIAVLLYGRPQEFLYIFSYMSFSLVLTIIYEKIKTPVPGIISHMALNICGVILMN